MTVDEGEIVALLGANGAGKTTTLRAVSGMVRRSGDVIVAGKRLRGAGPESVARVGRRARARRPRHLLRADGLGEPAHGRVHATRRPDFKIVLDYFPWLESRRNQQAGTLSGGEQQMLALARAFLQRPRLLMLDEPSLGLAPLITREVFSVVGDLNQKEGLAVLVVEQNAAIALVRGASRLRPRDRLVALSGDRRRTESERRGADGVPRVLMQQFLQTLVSGLARGAIYGSLALALVLIYKATEVINFAQGEMAMFTTYIAWALMEHHGALLLARVLDHARDRVLLRRRSLRRRRSSRSSAPAC